MSGKKTVFNTILIIGGVALGLTILAGLFLVTRQTVIPVTADVNSASAAQDAPQQSLYVGLGNTLEIEGERARVIAPPFLARQDSQNIYLGAGYTLEMRGADGRIVAPVSASQSMTANDGPSSMDLGAGYTLEMHGTTGVIVAPAFAFQQKSAAVNTSTMDLGAGYTLEISGAKGVIVPPAARPVPTRSELKIDIGGGYWWVNGQLVHGMK